MNYLPALLLVNRLSLWLSRVSRFCAGIADEVALIWCKHKGPLGYVFLLNRYITPLGFVVNMSRTDNADAVNYFKCDDEVPLTIFCGVHALYRDSCREIHDFPPYEVIVLARSATRAWLPLAYDTAIFTLTLWHILPSYHRNGAVGHSDVLTVMIIRALPGLKGIAAQLTVVMTSRVITLNLKKQVNAPWDRPNRGWHNSVLRAVQNAPEACAVLTPVSWTVSGSASTKTEHALYRTYFNLHFE
ncbi:hypothetical protein F4604DRAFT_1676630 [Suillus subluteus]|nr:hypothetical protein F4604DRAFT_1676630 [Suillus subluteus]